jgi:hypothetical protein
LNGLKVLEIDLNQQNFIPRKKGAWGERRKKRRRKREIRRNKCGS